MKKINVAKLLKDCPQNMELDCTMFNKVTLFTVDDREGVVFPITVFREDGNPIVLTKYGQYTDADFAKCVIFPKGKTTWEGFVPPCQFKDGDIIFTHANCLKVGVGNTWISIFKERRNGGVATYVDYAEDGSDYYSDLDGDKALLCMESDILRQRFATEEEKAKLLQAIKDNGYHWNTETKTLEKLVEPQFNVGDWIIRNNKYTGIPVKVIEFNGYYSCELNGEIVNLTRNDVHNNFHLWTIQDAKDGDVLVDKDNNIGIFQKFEGIYWYSYIYLGCDGKLRGFSIGGSHKQTDVHPATKEQRDFLFQKIKEAGYKWNSETKTLEKLIKPIFKAGNKVRNKNNHNIVFTITSIEEDSYVCGAKAAFWFDDQDDYELVPNKFDITTLKPFDKVLVRDSDKDMWCASIFSHTWKDKYFCIDTWHNQCIPYEANKKLLGTTNNPAEYGSE